MCHILTSLPIHLLLVLQVPKAIIRNLNGLFTEFFCGEEDGRSKRNWRALKKLCLPVEEREIGVRNLEEIQRSLFLKFG